MSTRRRSPKARALLLGVAGAVVLVACQDLFVEPASSDTAGLAILLHATSSARGQGDAFERAERARIRLLRGSAVIFDEQLDLPPSGSERVVDVEVEIEGDTETLQLQTQLLWSGNVLFEGTASVSLQRGGTTGVDVALAPVAAGLDVPATAGPITSIGGTLQLTGAVVYATGDAIAGATIAWTSLDPGIATVTPQGLVTARAEGEARITASALGRQATVRVTVQIAVAAVDVSPTAMELTIGESRQATATPRDAGGNPLNRTVTWQSSAPGVATVDGTGIVRGIAAGTATITASAGGATSAGIAVVVSDVPVASVTVEPATATLSVAQTVQLQATVRDAAGNVLTGRVVTWSSNNAAVATVNGSGLVTAAAGGQATITATSGGRGGSAQITVQAPSIQVSADLLSLVTTAGTNPAPRIIGVGNGGTGTLSGLSTSIAYSGAAQGWLTATLSGTAAPATLTLEFVVAGLGEGNYRAVVTLASSLPGVAAKDITVDLAVRLVPVATVRVAPAASTLLVGQTVQLTATTLDASDNVLTGRAVTWTTSDQSVATVSSSGLVTAVAGGSATITATSEGQSGTATITVDVPAIALSTSAVSVGTPVGRDPAPAAVNVANGGTGTLSGLSSSIAYNGTAGWLTAQLGGTTAPTTLTLTFAAAALAEGTYSAIVTVASSLPGVASQQITVDLAVRQTPVASVTVTPPGATLMPNETVQLTATMRDSMNVVLGGRAVTWTTSNAAIAVVTPTGLVTAVGPGRATITATSEGVPGTAVIDVVLPAIVLSPGSVTFQTTVGVDPQMQNVTISNGGGGTLSGLTTSVAYPAGAPQGWLSITSLVQPPNGSLTLAAFVANTSLPAGTYTATVTVSSSQPFVQAVQLPVTLQVLPPQYAIRIGGFGTGSGTITGPGIDCSIAAGQVGGACIASYPAGTQVTLQATPAQGSRFVTWGGDCVQYGSGVQCFVNVDRDLAVSAQFDLLTATAPVISNLRTVVQLSAACLINNVQWTEITQTFDYADADGDLPNPVTVTYDWQYNPTRVGTYTNQWPLAGSGSSGSVTFGYCHQFAADSVVTESFYVTDASGLPSNRLSATTRRPAGSSSADLEVSGGAASGAAVSSGTVRVAPTGAAPVPVRRRERQGGDDMELSLIPTAADMADIRSRSPFVASRAWPGASAPDAADRRAAHGGETPHPVRRDPD